MLLHALYILIFNLSFVVIIAVKLKELWFKFFLVTEFLLNFIYFMTERNVTQHFLLLHIINIFNHVKHNYLRVRIKCKHSIIIIIIIITTIFITAVLFMATFLNMCSNWFKFCALNKLIVNLLNQLRVCVLHIQYSYRWFNSKIFVKVWEFLFLWTWLIKSISVQSYATDLSKIVRQFRLVSDTLIVDLLWSLVWFYKCVRKIAIACFLSANFVFLFNRAKKLLQ